MEPVKTQGRKTELAATAVRASHQQGFDLVKEGDLTALLEQARFSSLVRREAETTEARGGTAIEKCAD